MKELDFIFWLICLFKLSHGQLPPVDRDQFAWITPLKGDISQQCLEASNKYVDQLLSLGQDIDLTKLPGALQMFDSNGRLPIEGFLSDTLDFPLDICQNDEYCINYLPDQLRFITLKIPLGFSNNPGVFDECLNSNDMETVYCQMMISGPPEYSMNGNIMGRDGVKSYPFNNIQGITKFNEQLTQMNTLTKSLTSKSTMYELHNYESFKEYIKKIETYSHAVPIDYQDYILYTAMAVFSTINMAVIGMCFPKECSMDDINKNYATLTAVTHNASQVSLCDLVENIPYPQLCDINLPVLSVDVYSTQCYTNENIHGTPDKFPGVFVFIYVVLAIIGVLMVAGTVSEMMFTFMLNKTTPDNLIMNLLHSFSLYSNGKQVLSTKSIGKDHLDSMNGMRFISMLNKTTPDNLIMNLLHSFSLYSNGKQVLSTKSVGKDHLDSMNGMRFISMTWVVLGHSFLIPFFGSTRNVKDAMDILGNGYNLAFEAILNAVPSVDSFFLMSGTLTTYIFLKELDRAGNDMKKHTITFIMYYLHRYLRITITYALIMGVIIAVLPYLYHGPNWLTMLDESEQCRQHWWKHLLYVHTLTKEEPPNRCMGVAWYLVDDMIFHVFSPIIIYPMYLAFKYTKKHLASIGFWFFSLFWFTFGVFYLSYSTKSPPGEGMIIEDFVTDYTYHVSFYFAPWARYQAYLIGILLGYILHHLRGKTVKIREDVNIFAWQAAFLSAFAVVYGLYNVTKTHRMTLFAATMYNTFQRIAWNGALAWVIFSCSKGYGGIINEFLSWSAFAPLSRLTFCSYLIHLNILQMFGVSVLSSFPNDLDIWATVWYYLAIQFLTLVVAFGLTLAFELPFVRSEKLIINALLKSIMGSPKSDATAMKNQNPESPKADEIDNIGNHQEIKQEDTPDKATDKEREAEESREQNNSSEQGGSDSGRHSDSDLKSENSSNPPSYDQIERAADVVQKT